MTGNAAQGLLADDGEDDAGRPYVLLGAAVDEVVLAHVYRAGHDVGGHVGNQGAGAVHVFLDFRTVDGVVGGDVEVVQIGRNLKALGDIAVVLVLGAGDGIGFADSLGLHQGLVGPDAGIQVGGLLLQVIHGHIKELKGGASAQEHHLVGVRNVQEFFPQGAALVHHGIPLFGAVADGKDGDTGAAEILESGDGIVNGYLRQKAGAGIEDMNFFGHNRIFVKIF